MDAKMRSKANKLQKLLKILSNPIKIFGKASYFFVKSLEICSNQISSGSWVGCPSAPGVQLPKSFSDNSFPDYNNEEFRQLSPAASQKEAKQTDLQKTLLPRSYNVAVGKIGRIDEEDPCEFEEQ